MRKTSYLAIIATGFALITLLASCSKEDAPRQTASSGNWRSNLKSVVDEQMSKTQNGSFLKEKNWKGTAAADAGGALSGAAAGYELFPHWGAAVTGAIIGGAAASCEYWFGRVYNNGGPGGPTIYNPTIENPFADQNNPYRYAGILHNEICKKVIDDSVMFSPDSIYLQEKVREIGIKIINERKSDFPELSGLGIEDIDLDYNALISPIVSNAENLNIEMQSSNNELNFFCMEFQRGLSYCSSKEDVYSLVKKMNAVIINSNLDETTKGSMLMSTSVLENSTWLWN